MEKREEALSRADFGCIKLCSYSHWFLPPQISQASAKNWVISAFPLFMIHRTMSSRLLGCYISLRHGKYLGHHSHTIGQKRRAWTTSSSWEWQKGHLLSTSIVFCFKRKRHGRLFLHARHANILIFWGVTIFQRSFHSGLNSWDIELSPCPCLRFSLISLYALFTLNSHLMSSFQISLSEWGD